jgi:NTE family protein
LFLEWAAVKLDRPRRALVLSGGGARGAYEAGVLRYLLEELPRRLGKPPRFDIITGASVGAIHACFLAATAHRPFRSGERLARIWGRLSIGSLASLNTGALLATPLRAMGWLVPRALRRGGQPLPARISGLLETGPLEALVRRSVEWRRIGANLAAGHLDAVSVAATEIATGRVVAFLQSRDKAAGWGHDQSLVSRPVELRVEHALASAAIPVLFPAVRVDDTYFADGGIRLNTPLAPALRLGADRVLVIPLRRGAGTDGEVALETSRMASFPNPLFLYGKVLNALLLDHIETDLQRMRVINSILERGERSFGPQFLERMNAAAEHEHDHPFRKVSDVVVRPSRDLGVLAGELVSSSRSGVPTWVRLLQRALGLAGEPFEADLLSYVLFDRVYTAPLVKLGMEDARRQEEELLRFFSDD